LTRIITAQQNPGFVSACWLFAGFQLLKDELIGVLVAFKRTGRAKQGKNILTR
jgi:hypothetical protein